jgi:hypothetical protein
MRNTGSFERHRRAARALATLATLAAVALASIAACGGDDSAASSTAVTDASADRTSADPRVFTDATAADVGDDVVVDARPGAFDATDAAACNVRLDAPPLMTTVHIPHFAPVAYNSNPPSSGPHYTTWANYQEYADPVDDRYLVHSLEHGAVLFLYKCEDAGCPAIIDALRAVRDAIPSDPLCDPSIRVRIIIAPRPANDVTVAAAAWGQTYRADCVDPASLAKFVVDHYAMAPENFCDPGITSF